MDTTTISASRSSRKARYFQILRLEAGLKGKCYLEAVQVVTTAEKYNDDKSGWRSLVVPLGTTLKYYPQWLPAVGDQSGVHLPRGIPEHGGMPQNCGRRCAAAQGGDRNCFEGGRAVRPDARHKEDSDFQTCGLRWLTQSQKRARMDRLERTVRKIVVVMLTLC